MTSSPDRSGEDGPLVGHRINGECVDLGHLEGFSRDCFAWRQRASSLAHTPARTPVQRRIEGGALTVLNEVLSWQTMNSSIRSGHGLET